ncbi:DUF5412 family protein [Priestia endophytica]|uniref:DUF5412 family protein n=1 Tax=Priestia endophytica TaxID=135735 RepID=UPI003D26ADAC
MMQNPVLKKVFKLSGIVLATLIVLIAIAGGLIYYFFFSMAHLPEGELMKKSTSPNNEYTVEFYKSDGGATTSFSVRGELLEKGEKDGKNIYWDYKVDDAKVKWETNKIININGHKLDVTEDIYDYRKN